MSTGAAPAKDFVAHLIESHEELISGAHDLRKTCETTGDLETQDMVIKRIQTHDKTLWMLKSFLKNL
jgi:starvation-inducible DNA-binding protein